MSIRQIFELKNRPMLTFLCATVTPTERKLRKMTSSSNLRYGSVRIDKLPEMINQEFKAQGTKYQVLPNFGICHRELGEIKVTSMDK